MSDIEDIKRWAKKKRERLANDATYMDNSEESEAKLEVIKELQREHLGVEW